MKILTLQIKREFLDKILSGKKKNEYREVTPKNAKKYIIQKEDVKEDEEDIEVIEYDAIQFLNGYQSNRPEVLVEVKDAFLDIFEDDNGEEIVYTQGGKEYVLARMDYELGKVLKKKNI